MRPLALDLYAGGGGVSLGLLQAGFDVVGVDLNPKCARYYLRGMARHAPPGARFSFVCADALSVPLEDFSFVWASPPCQAHTCLRPLTGKDYPDLIPATRERLAASGIPYAIENVPGAPLGGFLTLLCGSMFGLATPDGTAELRRHRLFETSWPIALRPQCQHGDGGHEHRVICVGGGKAMSGGMAEPQGALRRRAVSVAGAVAQHKTSSDYGKNISRQTYSTTDAQHAMGIDWLPMKYLSQAIPPPYARWIGEQALEYIGSRHAP